MSTSKSASIDNGTKSKPIGTPSPEPGQEISYPELTVTFRRFQLSAKGLIPVILGVVLVFPVTAGLGWRIATLDFSALQAAIGKSVSYLASIR
jgi:hypothetical protein